MSTTTNPSRSLQPLVGATAGTAKEYKHVIELASFWGAEHWHFPGEMLMALAYVTQEQVDRSYFHVTERKPYVLNWLGLMGISEDRVIEGKIMAKHLLVPEAGRCGTPARKHVDWLQTSLQKLTGVRMTRTVILSKRAQRGAADHDAIEASVKEWAKQNDFEFVLRRDDKLGTIREQVEFMQRAAILVHPHGAQEVFDIGVQRGACKIEMLDVHNINLCYARVSFLSGHQYNAVSCILHDTTQHDDPTCVSDIIRRLDTCIVPEGLEGGWILGSE